MEASLRVRAQSLDVILGTCLLGVLLINVRKMVLGVQLSHAEVLLAR